MRNLSEKEKEIIKDILFRSEECNSDWVDLSMVYNHIFWSNMASYDSGTLYWPYENCYDEASINFYREVLETTILLKQLEENRYIHIMDKSMDSNKIKAHYCCYDKPSPKIYSLKLSPEISQIFDDANNKQLFVSQRLRTLVENDFKTYEEIQLEEAQKQTNIANESLEEARKQTESANKSLEEARKQTKASLDSLAETIKQTQKTQESLDEAQKQSYQARTQTGLSIFTLFLSVCAILWSIYASNEIPITINQSQFDSIQIQQKVLIETLNEIKMSQMDKDSVIKELDSTKAKIDEISNTLKELKKMNSKGK